MYVKKIEEEIRCPLEFGLKVFGGRWKSRVICVLNEKKTLRYSQLRREMVNITDTVLASTLKELIADEIIQRRATMKSLPGLNIRSLPNVKNVIMKNMFNWRPYI